MTRVSVLRRRDSGCPMPPPAPRTATFVCLGTEEENVRELAERARTAERVNMMNVAVVVVEMDAGERRGGFSLNPSNEFNFIHREMPRSEWLGREFTRITLTVH